MHTAIIAGTRPVSPQARSGCVSTSVADRFGVSGGQEIGTAVILYGADGLPTPIGKFPVLAKLKDHRSQTYDAPMPYTLRLTADGVSIHASNVRWGYATHGCVGVPPEFAARLFDTVSVGDEVLIVGQPRAKASERLSLSVSRPPSAGSARRPAETHSASSPRCPARARAGLRGTTRAVRMTETARSPPPPRRDATTPSPSPHRAGVGEAPGTAAVDAEASSPEPPASAAVRQARRSSAPSTSWSPSGWAIGGPCFGFGLSWLAAPGHAW